MTAIQWPTGIPQAALADGYDEEDQSIVAEFQPEIGMPLLSRRASEEVESVKFATKMTIAQYDELKAWRRTTLKSGTQPFQRQHPRKSSVTVTALFTTLGAPNMVSDTKCIVSMEMLMTVDE